MKAMLKFELDSSHVLEFIKETSSHLHPLR